MSDNLDGTTPSLSHKQTILIVDDSMMNRALLADMIGDDYDIIEAENGIEAIAAIQNQGTAISLMLLDIVMPEMDGFEVLAVMNKNKWIDEIPVIMVSSESASSYIERAYDLGVTDFISRPFDANIVRRRVTNTLMLFAKQKTLMGMITDEVYQREKDNSLMVSILSHIVEFRNGESCLHVLHVSTMTELLLNQVVKKTDQYNLSANDVSLISMASSLHDIGKISIPDSVLNKPGKLTDEEFEIMKTHAAVGSEMLTDVPVQQEEPLVRVAYEITRWHHERYDGRGYPDGLVGEEIPISAQVVSLADVYDALTSERVYKKAFSHEKAMKMILGGECGTFNPFLLQCLVDIEDEIQEQLKVTSLSTRSERDIQKVIEETLLPGSNAVSNRTLSLLDYERMKYHFFASMSNEIQYEYTQDTDVMLISDWGIRKLNLPETIRDPYNNEELKTLFGSDRLKALGRALRNTTPENPVVHTDFEVEIDGGYRWFHLTAQAIWVGDDHPEYQGSLGKMVDVHERHEQLNDLTFKATHDSLTGLMNHSYARQVFADRMKSHPDGRFVLIVMDMDHFKNANDTKGHLFGDQVLQFLAEILTQCVRGDDIVARVGGDEFVIGMEVTIDPEPLIERIFSSIPSEYEGFPISVSMGIACARGNECSYNALFRCADEALCDMKKAGRGGYIFSTSALNDDVNKDEVHSVLSVIESAQQENIELVEKE